MFPRQSNQNGSGGGGQSPKRTATPRDNALIAHQIALLTQPVVSGANSVLLKEDGNFSPNVSSNESEGPESSDENEEEPEMTDAVTSTSTSARIETDDGVADATHREKTYAPEQHEVPVEPSSGGGGDVGDDRDDRDGDRNELLTRLQYTKGLVSSPAEDDSDDSASDGSHFISLDSMHHRPRLPRLIDQEDEGDSEKEGFDYGDSDSEPEPPGEGLEDSIKQEKEAVLRVVNARFD